MIIRPQPIHRTASRLARRITVWLTTPRKDRA